jgi:hypothetical protein
LPCDFLKKNAWYVCKKLKASLLCKIGNEINFYIPRGGLPIPDQIIHHGVRHVMGAVKQVHRQALVGLQLPLHLLCSDRPKNPPPALGRTASAITRTRALPIHRINTSACSRATAWIARVYLHVVLDKKYPRLQATSGLAIEQVARRRYWRCHTRSTTTGAADGPAGMRGALRRAGGGRQPMAFIGRRHFNDARLIEERFRLTEP